MRHQRVCDERARQEIATYRKGPMSTSLLKTTKACVGSCSMALWQAAHRSNDLGQMAHRCQAPVMGI